MKDLSDQEFPEPLQLLLERNKKEEKSNDAAFRFSCIIDDAMLARVVSAATECRIINETKRSEKTRRVTK